jgi:polyphosphate kinase
VRRTRFVDDQYRCWNDELRPQLAHSGIRVLGLHELDARAKAFNEEYSEKELDLLLTPVTIDPAHPFPRVINKALCVAFLLLPPSSFVDDLYRGL